jgi:hypothetical protein
MALQGGDAPPVEASPMCAQVDERRARLRRLAR